jgi:predicted PurR-regulated permease PerM
VASDLSQFWQQLPAYVDSGLSWLCDRRPSLYEKALEWAREEQEGLSAGSLNIRNLLSQGVNVVSAIGNVILVLIIAIYLLADRGRSVEGLLRRLPPARAEKVRRSVAAAAMVINGYVVGQSINSALFAGFTLVILSLLHVPSAVVLALIAAIGDAIPQIGVILATIPALLLALTKSGETALIVLAAYVSYQQVENYVTSPRVFARTLDLSPLVTLLAVLIGGSLLGVIGILLALPVAAATPVVARIWLEDDGAANEEPAP